MKKTLMKIYNWKEIENPETSLLKQVNSIIKKTPDELTTSDICLLLRQEMFLDLVIPLAIKEISNNPSVGDYYDYQMIINLSQVTDSLIQYQEDIKNLIEKLEAKKDSITFELESDKSDYLKSIESLKAKIANK